MAARPRREKFDRLLNPDANAETLSCSMAVAPFDRVSREMSLKWGQDRLPELVSSDMASKFGSALGKLNAAINSNDVDEVKARVEVCIRGYAAMDAEAERLGAPKADPRTLEYDLDGFRFGILPDDSFWPAAKEARPDLRLYTLREVANALRSLPPLVDVVKQQFPGAKITNVTPTKPPVDYDLGGDFIPF